MALLIHIGPDSPLDAALAQLYRANGLTAICHADGRLATDILYAMGQGTRPLRDWPDADLITGLFRHRPPWRPPLEAWRCAAFLRTALPQARFLLTTPPPDAWAAWRMGTPAAACHARQGWRVDWQADLQAHLAAMRDLFAGDGRLIIFDPALHGPADLAAMLAPVADLPHLPFARWPDMPPAATAPAPRAPSAPQGWAQDVAAFCLSGLDPKAKGGDAGLSPMVCHWDGTLAGRGAVTDAKGHPRQFTLVTPPGRRPLALARQGRHFKLIRAEGVINDILSLDRRDPVRIDMEDSRWFGSPQGEALDRPVLCHNRRAGAVNAVLWPLPDQHGVGMAGFDPAMPPDDIPWADKQDRLVWRGMISGSEMRDGVKPGPASHTWLRRLDEADGPQARAAAWEGLCRTNRMAAVRRFAGHPDIDMGIVMAHAYRHHEGDPLIAPYVRPRMGPDDFNAYRYRLCMTGYDHGSNFVSGLDHNGVLLAEENGWQVFYSGRFRPWVHYIPVARYLTDLEDKLAWARAHPDACRAMSQAARTEAAHLRDPAARAQVMRLILDGLAQAG